jgi:hypothetical protein
MSQSWTKRPTRTLGVLDSPFKLSFILAEIVHCLKELCISIGVFPHMMCALSINLRTEMEMNVAVEVQFPHDSYSK